MTFRDYGTLSEQLLRGEQYINNNPYAAFGMQKPSFADYMNIQAATLEEMDRQWDEQQRSGFFGGTADRGGARQSFSNLGVQARNAAIVAQMRGGHGYDYDSPEGVAANRQTTYGGFGTYNPFNSRVYGMAGTPGLNGVNPAHANYLIEAYRGNMRDLEASWPQNAGKGSAVTVDAYQDLPKGINQSSFNNSQGEVYYSPSGPGGQISQMQYNPSTGSWASSGYLNALNAVPWNPGGGSVVQGSGMAGMGANAHNSPMQHYGGNLGPWNNTQPGMNTTGNRGTNTIMRQREPGNYSPYPQNTPDRMLDDYSYGGNRFGATNTPFQTRPTTLNYGARSAEATMANSIASRPWTSATRGGYDYSSPEWGYLADREFRGGSDEYGSYLRQRNTYGPVNNPYMYNGNHDLGFNPDSSVFNNDFGARVSRPMVPLWQSRYGAR